MRKIQILFRFTNFYQQFIQTFSQIAILFISILKTIKITKSTVEFEKTKIKVNNNSIINNSEVTNEISSIKKIK